MPRYETAEDIAEETEAIELFCCKTGSDYRKLPESYHVDFGLVRAGKLVATVEYKGRKNDRYGKWPEIPLSMNKLIAGRSIHAASGAKFIFLAGMGYGLYFADLTEGVFQTTIMGRTDRGDGNDVQPSVLIPNALFKKVSV